MKRRPFDPANLNRVVEVLDSIHKHRARQPLNQADALYYELLAGYYREIRDARDNGKRLIHHTAMLPAEILYAMDMVSSVIEPVAGAVVSLNSLWDQSLATAGSYGLGPDICSLHRHPSACVLEGWLPEPDAVIWSNLGCDYISKAGDILASLWECPSHFLDRGYDVSERELAYLTGEVQSMIEFLEQIAVRKMDWDRLVEAVEYTRQLMELEREIAELRKQVPAPVSSRTGMYMHVISMLMAGTPEAITFFRQMRDDAKELVERGSGVLDNERHRLVLFFEPPIYGWKLLDWMEREYGAVIVAEPAFSGWGPGQIDPTKPVEALARKTFIRPVARQLQGPVDVLLADMVEAAKAYRADGVISFSHLGCRQSTPCNRLLKETITKETGLPFLAIDHDIADPAIVAQEEMRAQIEAFFETIRGEY